MDSPNPLPTPPTPEATPQIQMYISPSSPFKKLLKISAVFLGIIILILTIILTLNYFKILHFSFLPQKSLTRNTEKPTAVSSQPRQPAFSCPVPKNSCEQGKIIENNEAFYGLGFNLPVGTALLAAFEGKVEDTPKVSNHPLLYLRDGKGKEAIYSFYGTLSVAVGSKVAAGAEIAKIGEGFFPPVAPFINLNITFSLKKDGVYQKVSPEEFGE